MANASEFASLFQNYMRARIPFVVIKSNERSRVRDLITDVVTRLHIKVAYHSPSLGLRDMASDRPIRDEPSLYGAMEHAAQSFKAAQQQTFIFSDVQDLGADSSLARQMLEITVLAENSNGCVVVVTNDPVWPELQRLGMAITLDPPDEHEMVEIVRSSIEPYRNQINVQWGDAEFRTAGTYLAGVTQIEAENILATLVVTESIGPGELDGLAMAKEQIFSDLAGLERIRPNENEETVGGLDGLRTWLDDERPFLTLDCSDRHIGPPRGVLLVGVPGCGKSLSAKQVASSWALPLYRLDLASILGRFVGQSESQLRQALDTADRVAPCVLWIDEIEKALAANSSDSTGTTQRLLGQFLHWLQESEARVFVVATANDVSTLPPELFRKGRFDEIFFVDLPGDKDRQEIIHIQWNLRMTESLDDTQIAQLVSLSEAFTGADITACVETIAKRDIRSSQRDGTRLSWEAIVHEFETLTPLSQTNPEIIESMRIWGKRAKPASTGETAVVRTRHKNSSMRFGKS